MTGKTVNGPNVGGHGVYHIGIETETRLREEWTEDHWNVMSYHGVVEVALVQGIEPDDCAEVVAVEWLLRLRQDP